MQVPLPEPPRLRVLSDDFLQCYACAISVPHYTLMQAHMMTSAHVRAVAEFKRRREWEDSLAEEASRALAHAPRR